MGKPVDIFAGRARAHQPARSAAPPALPGNALLEKFKQADLNRRQGPSIDPVHAAATAVHALLHGTASPEERKRIANQNVSGAPIFTGATAAIDALIHLPSQLHGARAAAVKISHPSKETPPSLGQNVQGLLSGALGIPRMGVNEAHKVGDVHNIRVSPVVIRNLVREKSVSAVQRYSEGHDISHIVGPIRADNPIAINFDPATGRAKIEDGNHRLGAALYNNEPDVPVRVRIISGSLDNWPQLPSQIRAVLGSGPSTTASGHPLLAARAPSFRTPLVPRGATTPETAGDLGLQVREGLRGAKAARVEQNKLYSVERGARAAAAEKTMTELGGQVGYQAALGKLKGELPKLRFGGFENFDQAGLDALFTHIQQHPTLRPFEKIRTQTALLNVLDGKVPTRSELDLMGRVFGKEVSGRIAASVPFAQKAKQLGIELFNVPRSLMASFDLSAPFRQGLVSGVAHPGLFVKNFAPMFKAFGSEKAYQGIMDDIVSRPSYPRMEKAGLAITDMGSLEQREEQFVSNLAERIPGIGRGVRASGRAYTGFLSKMRADVFDQLVRDAEGLGRDVGDPRLLKDIATFVNSATGRGDLGAFQKHAVTLNTAFFSPRLLWSRLNFLNPVYYARLDPFARKEALKAARNLVVVLGTTLYLSKLAGADVNTDPRNADFAKMKFGNTRFDVLGGFQQPVRLLSQLFSGKVISSTTGKTLSLGPQGPGKLSRKDIAQRFVESKLAPVPSFINDVAKGTDFTGQPLHWDFSSKNPAFQRMLPLLGQDAYALYQQEGLLPAVGGYGIGAFGFGVQSYAPKSPKGGGGSKGGGVDIFSGGGSRSRGGGGGGIDIFGK